MLTVTDMGNKCCCCQGLCLALRDKRERRKAAKQAERTRRRNEEFDERLRAQYRWLEERWLKRRSIAALEGLQAMCAISDCAHYGRYARYY